MGTLLHGPRHMLSWWQSWYQQRPPLKKRQQAYWPHAGGHPAVQRLGSLKWLQYDQQYREWAAASGKRVRREVNLSIYGRCLCTPTPSISEREMRLDKPQTQSKKEPCKSKGKNKACFKHNFEISCGRTEQECFFDHVCWYCAAPNHIAGDCPQVPKRAK